MTGTVVSKAVLSARGGAVTSAEPFPALFLATPKAQTRFWEFFTAHIRNKHTRAAYLAAAGRFSAWCEGRRLVLEQVQPVHVAGYVEQLSGELAAPSVKQHLAALRMLFDWLVVGQVIPFNPAHAVRGPKHSAKRGKTPVLSEEQARTLIQSIDASSLIGLRDRALITLMLYTFARVGAVTKMKVQDFAVEGDQPLARLHEKGGKFHKVGLARKAEEFLRAYVDAAGDSGGCERTVVPDVGQSDGYGANAESDGAAGRVPDDSQAGESRRHPREDQLPHVPGDRHHGVPAERRAPGNGAVDRQSRVRADYGAV